MNNTRILWFGLGWTVPALLGSYIISKQDKIIEKQNTTIRAAKDISNQLIEIFENPTDFENNEERIKRVEESATFWSLVNNEN